MQYYSYYESPLGKILLAADDTGLTGLWFDGGKYSPKSPEKICKENNSPILENAGKWLDVYFSGRDPGYFQPLHLVGTDFRKTVWNILLTIPYGKTMTYGEIAALTAKKKGLRRMSPQAVGGAIGHNPISIIVPCHRVIGSDGSLTGYAGGVEKKAALLRLEHALSDERFHSMI